MELQICPFALLFFLLQFVPAFSSLTLHLCHHDESIALLQFKELFNISPSSNASANCNYYGQYSYPKISSWNKSRDCCTWDGVTCHKMTSHVIGLDLSCSQLEGAISPNSSLFQLSQLEKLNLAFNDFKGSQISHGFGRFPRLMHLNLSNSNFNGQIASEISHLSKLVSLDLSLHWSSISDVYLNRLLTYDFPLVQQNIRFGLHDFQLLLQNLTHISVLCLSDVDISSEVPLNLSSSLSYLDLSHTRIHGKLPNDVFQLPKLQTLRLLDNQNLTGSFPKFNCSISPLQELDFSWTNFFGELPSSIGCLKSLKILNLGYCQFSGPLPNIGNFSELIGLDLSYNNFTGQIPTSISSLRQLQYFVFSSNNLVGCFLQPIANLSDLEYLDIRDNSIAGPLPSNVSGLQKLTRFDLGKNSLNGTLPSWLFRLPKLEFLDLSRNHFTGQIYNFKGNLPLSIFFLYNNQLSGPIPKSISMLLNLRQIDLSTNNLTGIIEPNMFLNLQNLEYLDLSDNRLQFRNENNVYISLPNLWYVGLSSCALKEFPNFLKSPKELAMLLLSNNNIDRLPNWFISMRWDSFFLLNLSHNSLSSLIPLPWKTLETLDFRFNQIQGPLPLFFCNLEILQILDLSNNQFVGGIPQCFGNFSHGILVLNLKNNRLQGKIVLKFATNNPLRSLGLNGNFLEGSLPRSLANCEQLEVLDVGNNNISDTFPTWLENLQELQVLILKSNRFFGSIGTLKTKSPFSNLRVIDISCNEFNGVLSTRLFKSFRAMTNVERNQSEARYIEIKNNAGLYEESIHIVTKGLDIEFPKILSTLTGIDVSSNKFSGEIPKVIGKLVAIKYLNLSHNRLSGHIPVTLGNLGSLESLDISCNQIDGDIPWQLTLVTSLEFLNLSQNHLMGRIPQGRQFNTFSNDSYKGNLGLCGSPLTMNCKANEVPPPLLQQIPQQEEDSDFFSGFTWQSVILGYGCGIFLGVATGTLMFLTRKPDKFVRFIEEEIHHCVLFLTWKIHMRKSFRRPKRNYHKDRRVVHW